MSAATARRPHLVAEPSSHRSQCRSCGELIAWLDQAKGARYPGRWQPIDPEPSEHGEYVLVGDGATAISLYYEGLPAGAFDNMLKMERYVDHRRTCSPRGVRNMRSSLDHLLREVEDTLLLGGSIPTGVGN